MEEVFGRWKNRFRVLLSAPCVSHMWMTKIIYASLVLHNMCTILKDNLCTLRQGTDEEWQQYFNLYGKKSCPSCTALMRVDCSHIAINKSTPAIQGCANTIELRNKIKDMLWDKHNADAQKELEEELRERWAARDRLPHSL